MRQGMWRHAGVIPLRDMLADTGGSGLATIFMFK
jgi:hypothetical protein